MDNVTHLSWGQMTYTSHWANGAPISARIFVHPSAMKIREIIKLAFATGRETRVTAGCHLELVKVQTAKSPN